MDMICGSLNISIKMRFFLSFCFETIHLFIEEKKCYVHTIERL